MNERIKELAEQAGMHRDKFGMYFAGDKHNEDGVDLEKFAELIVRECALTVQDFVDHRFPASEYPDRLKRYFGVEE